MRTPARAPDVLRPALEHLVKGIVDHPDDVRVRMVDSRRGQRLEVRPVAARRHQARQAAHPPHHPPVAVLRQAQAPPRPVLFRGARVIVGDGRVVDDAAVLVQDGRLVAVGRRAEVTAPAAVTGSRSDVSPAADTGSSHRIGGDSHAVAAASRAPPIASLKCTRAA